MSMYATIETEKRGTVELPLELDPKSEGLVEAVYGNNLPNVMGELDRLAIQRGIRPITSFIVNNLMDDENEGIEEENEDVDSMWFWPDECLVSVNALIQSLTNASPSSIKNIFGQSFPPEDIRWILWDLEAYRTILEEAHRANDRFRIVVC